MIIACLVLSSLALLTAAVNITLYLVDKKREPMRRQALVDYINNISDGTLEAAETNTAKRLTEASEVHKKEYTALIKKIDERFSAQQGEIEKLKEGAYPDYQQALIAARTVNDFNASIVSIMNFDPIEAARRSRNNGTKEDD